MSERFQRRFFFVSSPEFCKLELPIANDQASPGATGTTGAQGPIGLTGPQGDAGQQGERGSQGLLGDSGTTGAQGPQGLQGLNGPHGPPGPINASTVHIIWEESSSGISEIFYRGSSDPLRGIINLSNDTGPSTSLQMTSIGDNVYVVWTNATLGSSDIFFRASNDAGRTFGSIINLSNDTEISIQPQVAASGDNVYVVWRGGNNIDFISSNYKGQTFGDPQSISPGNSLTPKINAFADNVYVVWHDIGQGNDIFYAASYDSGQNFSNSSVDISNNPGISVFPKITATQDNVYVVWQDSTPGNSEIFFRGSNDFEPIRLTNTATESTIPQITSVGDNVCVVWQDPSLGNFEIFYRGNTQISTDPIDISNSGSASSDAHISAN